MSTSAGQSTSSQMGQAGTTGAPNLIYDVTSVLYHALESASTVDKYIRDAQGNSELQQFFQKVQQDNKQQAQQAQQLLSTLLSSSQTAH